MLDFFINKPDNQIPVSLTTNILLNAMPLAYHTSLPVYKSTPLHHLPALAKEFGVANIFLKDESYRFGLNAFKGLGASYAIYQLLQVNSSIETFCTATDGNHGRAVAWSAKMNGKKAIVFVPQDTTLFRMAAIEKEGAIVEKINGNYDETCTHALQQSQLNGWTLVQDTAWQGYEAIPAQIMAGYLTHFQELENDLHSMPPPNIDFVFLQAGVGSWAAAGIWYYLNRYGSKRPKMIIVEPYESDGILASFKQGERTSPKGNYQTIMAGLNCGIPSLSAWDIILHGADAALRIKDDYAEIAMRRLYAPTHDDPPVKLGESGVGGIAGFMALMKEENLQPLKEVLAINAQSNVLFFGTEGDTDPVHFAKIINAS